jgi:RimJ/RimL family protein N-acetyltransferase
VTERSVLPEPFPPEPTLRGARVALRALRDGDADDLYALHSDPRVMRYWSSEPWTRREQATAHLAMRRRDSGDTPARSLSWAAAAIDTDRLVGTVSLFALRREHRCAELGYALASDRWGRGLAGEMLDLALAHAFGALDLERLEADVDPRNERSCRLLERLGFRREGLLRARWRVGGEVTDSAIYGLLRTDRRPVLQAPD